MTLLVLDSDIRDWVVLPLFVIIVISSLIRQSVSQYMQYTTVTRIPILQHVYRIQNCIQSSTYLRYQYKVLMKHHILISSQQFRSYIQYRIALLRNEITYLQSLKDSGTKWNDATTSTTTTPAAAPSDPMMDMMMKNPMSLLGNNMIFMIQNMVMMQGIQHFFSGFILLQIPFTLTIGFKSMFQKGVAELPHLSSSYVSSVSWYFLVLYGLRSFLSLLIGTIPYEQKEQDIFVQQHMGYVHPPNPSSPNGGKQDYDTLIKLVQTEIDHLELVMVPKNIDAYNSNTNSSNNNNYSDNTESNNNCVEQRILGNRYPKRINTLSNTLSNEEEIAKKNTNLLFSISQTKTITTTSTNTTKSSGNKKQQ